MRKSQQFLWLSGFIGVSIALIISLLTTDISSVERPSASQPDALLAANIDQDQLVTLHEVRQMLEGHFGRLDTDKDGMINPDEYADQHIKLFINYFHSSDLVFVQLKSISLYSLTNQRLILHYFYLSIYQLYLNP